MAAVSNPLSILHSLPCIGEQPLHLLLTLHEILTALIAHPVLVRQLLIGLETQQNVMGIRIPLTGIMDVVGSHQRDVQLPAHLQQLSIHQPLLRITVVLKLQEKISSSKAGFVLPGGLPGLFRKFFCNISLYFPGQTGGQCDQPLVIAVQNLHIHSRLIVISFSKAFADDLHQIGITRIVLSQQHQMIVSVLAAGQLLVKAGIRCNVNLTADHRIDTRRLCCPIEINDTVHNAMVRDGCAVHSQFLHPGNIFLYFIGTVQEGILRVNVKMCKCHIFPFLSRDAIPASQPVSLSPSLQS